MRHEPITLDETRKAWQRAGKFPANKEAVYFEHKKVQEFDTHKGKRVLEYGCGGGSDAMSYLRRQCTVWYVDITPQNVTAATERIAKALLDKRAYGCTLDDSAKIPVGDGYFEIVNAHGVLHHIVDPLPVLKEFHRLLKPDGLLYVMLYSEHLFEKFKTTIDALMNGGRCKTDWEAFCWCTDGEGTPYARAYSVEGGTQFLEAGGFKVLTHTLYQNNDFRTFKAVRV